MATGTPFHSRTEPLCRSYDWRQWSGYLAVGTYNDFVQPEYAAIRNSAALIDISPLYKYEVSGRDAERVLDRVVTQDMTALTPGRVAYTPWCDVDGKVRQEGTVFRLASDRFQVCAAEPAYAWLQENAVGFQVRLEDRSAARAALSLQGPHARSVLDEASDGAVGKLGFFRCVEARVADRAVTISRTGFTGDLGYEIWLDADDSLTVWDALMAAGRRWQITPCGLAAMDIARVEAGFILIGVDYTSSEFAHIPEHAASPYELGLDWTVKLHKERFVGRDALEAEHAAGPRRRVVGIQIDWEPLEAAFLRADLMPELPMTVCREAVPLYAPGVGQVGRVTSRVWSRLLKRYLGLATVDAAHARPGTPVEMELTVNYSRRRVAAQVVPPSFFRPDRMRSG